jgi:hypothetical protein
MSKSLPALIALALCVGCESVRGTEPSNVTASQVVASGYWFRGSPKSLEPVTQGDVTVHSPLAWGGTLSLITWYSLQLTNRTGDAVVPDGNGGQATEIDIAFHYTDRIGWADVSAGAVGYAFPNVGPSTKEFYLGAAADALGLYHALTLYYDSDLLDDYYLSYQAAHGFELGETWSLTLSALLGYMSDGQARFYFGADEHGFSDLSLSADLSYHLDENTSAFLKVSGVTVPNDDLSGALDAAGIDNRGVWVTLGAAWGL